MKRAFLSVAILAAAFCFPLTAKAVLVGSNTIALDGTVGEGWAMSNLSGSTLTNLSTLITNARESLFFRRGQTLYYPAAEGIAKQIIGQATSSLAKKLSNYSLITRRQNLFVVSDTAARSAAKGSYLYNISTKKITRFTPKIGQITQAQFSSSGKWLAVLTKNSKNKPLFYVSAPGHAEVLSAATLPTNTKKCTALAIAPDNASIALVCEFTQENSTSTTGLLLGTYAKGVATFAKKPYYDANFSLSTVAWTTSKKLVSAGFGISATASQAARSFAILDHTVQIQSTPVIVSAIHSYTVAKQKVTRRTIQELDTSSISADPATIFLPMQLTRIDSNSVMFMSFVMTSDSAGALSGITTYIGSYNLQTRLHNILLNNSKVNVLGDVPVAGS